MAGVCNVTGEGGLDGVVLDAGMAAMAAAADVGAGGVAGADVHDGVAGEVAGGLVGELVVEPAGELAGWPADALV